MTTDAFMNFGDIVSKVLEDAKIDPVQHILVLTYEFDDQQLVNLVCSRNLEEDFELRQAQLKILSNLRPLAIYDARKTKAFSKIPQFLELHPFKTPGFSCHHSKAYLIITEKAVRLVLGSFNLTMSGLFRNREVFEAFYWDANEIGHIEVLGEWTAFLRTNYQGRLRMSSASALNPIIDTLESRHQAWKRDQPDDSMHLLYSGYNETTGLSELRRHWNRWFPGEYPDSLIAVSPFFDESPQFACLARDLQSEFAGIEAFTLITDEQSVTTLSQAHFGNAKNNELLLIPAELSPTETARIERLARHLGNSAKDQRFSRTLHAKVLMLRRGGSALAYMGSANFSRKAWQGSNQELGLVWKESDPESLRRDLMSNLGAVSENQFGRLPPLPPPKVEDKDDETYSVDMKFPGFIEMILLAPNELQTHVQFRFELGVRQDDKPQLSFDDYLVQWAGYKLDLTENHSQWISREDFQNKLIASRNIAFQLVSDPTQVFWFPFQYEGNLIAERETFLHPTSWDWMSFYLNPNQDTLLGDGEFIPGEPGKPEITGATDLDAIKREENCVIAMQVYLTQFVKIERDFCQRIEDVKLVMSECQLRALNLQIVEPLSGLCRLLEREALDAQRRVGAKEVTSSDVFKLGELSLLIKALEGKASQELRTAFEPLQFKLDRVLSSWRVGNELKAAYLDFVSSARAV